MKKMRARESQDKLKDDENQQSHQLLLPKLNCT